MRTLIVGAGGREASIAWRLGTESELFAVTKFDNPTISARVKASGGECVFADATDIHAITEFAKTKSIDLAWISSDASLEAGVVDALREAGIRTVGPTRAGAEIEWNKAFAMDLTQKILPEHSPWFITTHDEASLRAALKEAASKEMLVVIKPQGLTGGKGVKVMGEHLKDYDEALTYGLSVLSGGHASVIVSEKLSGIEFNLQVLTDGTYAAPPPATYDHPYRYDGDTGPGTGGMGSFTDARELLPFITKAQYETCLDISEAMLAELRKQNQSYSGILYPSFFAKGDDIKIIEFNARPGDPECMNIMSLLATPLIPMLEHMESNTLAARDIAFKEEASVVKYLVSPEYAVSEGAPHEFEMDIAAIEREGVAVFFASATEAGKPNTYRTVGNSRAVALAATARSIPEASARIETAIREYTRGDLEHRKDIGTQEELALLKSKR